jgi:hypothetical protein
MKAVRVREHEREKSRETSPILGIWYERKFGDWVDEEQRGV